MRRWLYLIATLVSLMPAFASAQVGSAFNSRTSVANVQFTGVPKWNDADILAVFAKARDTRYLFYSTRPDIARRISWMYIDNGCQSRAEQLGYVAGAAGMAKPYKIFAFGGSLLVRTENHPDGYKVFSRFHTAALVKNQAGEPMCSIQH